MTGTNVRNLGIIGAGQLARMICLAAHTIGIRTTVFAGHATDCAVEVANDVVLDQKNSESLKLFLDRCDLVTFENEFFDLRRILELGGNYAFAPDLHSMGALQSKLGQKLLLQKLKIPTSRFVAFDEHQLIEMERVIKEDFRRGCVIKRAFGGYDGRGNISISSKFKGFTKEQSLALEKWGSYYIEEFIGFKNEVSIVGARNKHGIVTFYPLTETFQKNGMCEWTLSPSKVSAKSERQAQAYVKRILAELNYVGVLAVEMFWCGSGGIFVNEIAPRVHNTGHWTLNGSSVSQFELHLRAILGMALPKLHLTAPEVAMVNINGQFDRDLKDCNILTLLGNEIDKYHEGQIHWYGKAGHSLNRKLGHINVCGKKGQTLKRAMRLRKAIKV